MKGIITIGLSASGKSTYAEEMAKKGYVQIERDMIRRYLFGFEQWNEYKFNKTNEERVTAVADQMLFDAHLEKKNVVISDTNLNPKYRNALIEKLKGYGYEVEIKEFPISYEEAIKRDTFRKYSVGQKVIYQQWQQWLEYINFKKYKPSGKLPDAVIFDLDGCLATMQGRRVPFEWSKVGLDGPRQPVFEMLDGYARAGYEIVFLSGRDSVCRTETTNWLNTWLYRLCEQSVTASEHNIFMRKEGDMRKDSIVKQELFWEHVAPKWDVQIVVDDRHSILHLWDDLGINTVVCVGNIRDNF